MVAKKVVGQVTIEEKDEIQTLFERRNGLNELAKIVTADNTDLYEKLVKDMGETGTKFQNWWDRMSQKFRSSMLPKPSEKRMPPQCIKFYKPVIKRSFLPYL